MNDMLSEVDRSKMEEKAKRIKLALKIISFVIIVCFFVPYFSVSCDNLSYTVSGFELAKGIDLEYGFKNGVEPMVFLLLILPFVAVIALFVCKDSRKTFIICAVIYVLNAIMLILLYHYYYAQIERMYGYMYGYLKNMYNMEIGFAGNEVISLGHKYNSVSSFSDERAMVYIGDSDKGYKYGFIDKTGNEVIPLKYDEARPFTEGLAAVSLDGKWGFVDKTGNETVPLKYFRVYWFYKGMAGVGIRDSGGYKYGFVDNTGNEVIPLIYDDVDFDKFYEFSEGMAAVFLDGKWGFIKDTEYKEITSKTNIPIILIATVILACVSLIVFLVLRRRSAFAMKKKEALLCGIGDEPQGFFFCTECGARLPASAEFCDMCGEKVILKKGVN